MNETLADSPENKSLLDVFMLAELQHRNLIADAQRALLRHRYQLHPQAAYVRPRAPVHGSEAAQRLVWLRGVALPGHLVDIGELAPCCSAGDVIFVVADLDAAPGLLGLGLRARDD